MKKYSLLTLIPLLILSSCQQSTPVEPEKDKTVTIEMNVTLDLERLEKRDKYKIDYSYNDHYFDKSAEEFNSNLALISLGISGVGANEEGIKTFFQTLEFNNYVSSLPEDDNPDSVKYYLAHKEIEDYHLVALFFRGDNYYAEWANNFEIGKEGDHAGISKVVSKLQASFNDYISTYQDKPIKLWSAGYSRAGAITNVLASRMLSSKDNVIKPENMFIYTFEAPRALSKEHAIAYKNVFNIYNGADIVAAIVPEEYGLYRCGIDIDIYRSNGYELLKKLNKNCPIKDLVIDSENYKTDKEFLSYVLKSITKKQDDETKSAETRELFYENFQPSLYYLLGRFASKGLIKMIGIAEDFAALTNLEKIQLFMSDYLYKFLKIYFDRVEIKYDDAKLKEACAVQRDALTSTLLDIIAIAQDKNKSGNLLRMIGYHANEMTYVLLKDYITNL